MFTTCSFPKLKLFTKPLTINHYVVFIEYFLGNSYKRFILMNVFVSKKHKNNVTLCQNSLFKVVLVCHSWLVNMICLSTKFGFCIVSPY